MGWLVSWTPLGTNMQKSGAGAVAIKEERTSTESEPWIIFLPMSTAKSPLRQPIGGDQCSGHANLKVQHEWSLLRFARRA